MSRIAQQPEKPKTDLAMKLLARALDPGARDGEAETSAVMFVRACRRQGIILPDLVTALAPARHVERAGPDPEPPACRIEMPFGQFAGMTLGEIAEASLGYITWAALNVRQLEVRSACAIVAAFYGLVEVAA
jgi:hypothetical protein